MTTLADYRNAHRWLLLALAIVILGFVRSYWSKFPQVEIGHHLHLLSATAWFALLAWQPKFATSGRMAQHRRNGMIGLMLAGATVASAILMLPGNIQKAVDGVGEGFVDPTFFYGITFFDVVTIIGFAVSVVMAMLNVKRLDDHAIWMISTVFWIVAPAFARLMVFPLVQLFGEENLNFFKVLYIIEPVILAAIVITAWRLRTRHIALVLAFLANASAYVCAPIGDNAMWRAFCEAVFL